MSIKLADTLAPMADFPAAMAEHIEFDDGENLQEKLDSGSLGGGGTVDLTGYKKVYTQQGELEINDDTIYNIAKKLKPGETFLDSTYTFSDREEKFPTSEKGSIRIVRGEEDDLSDTVIEWYTVTGGYATGAFDSNENFKWTLISDPATGGKSIYAKKFKIGRWNLLAKIKLDSAENSKHILSFSCLNTVPVSGSVDYVFSKEADLCKYELHFTNPDLTSIYNATYFNHFGFVLYEYPMPEGTSEGIKNLAKNIGVYYDRDNLTISIFLINAGDADILEGRYIGNMLMNLSMQYTGSGMIVDSLKKDTHTVWGAVSWNEMCEFKDLEYPTIVRFGEDVDLTGYGKVYTSLAELGLDTTATINDIIGAMEDGSQFAYKTDVFNYATEYNNIQYGTVTIHKQSDGRAQVLMIDKNTGNLYVGRMDATNKIIGWRNESFHRVVAQATAGYFKFKPTSDGGFDQPLRISATDNYGGMIEISGNAPSQDQYKPYKCVRLSNGTYASYDAANTTNNKMKKLYLYNGYMYLQVETYTTVTFTGLIEAPTFVETLADTSTEIPIVSLVNPSIKAAAGSNINSVGTPSVTASESNGTTTFTFNYLKGAKGDKGDTGANGTTPTIKAAAGSNINTVGTPSVTASTSGTTTTFTFNNLKGATGANGTTPTIKASAGSNIGSVGTPSVSASTSGTTTTFTFNYLKGAKGDTGATGATGSKGDKGDAGYTKFPSTPGVLSSQGTVCSLSSKQIAVLFCIGSGGGSLSASNYPSGLTFNGSAWSSGTKSISVGTVYTINNNTSSSVDIKAVNNGGAGFLVFGPM